MPSPLAARSQHFSLLVLSGVTRRASIIRIGSAPMFRAISTNVSMFNLYCLSPSSEIVDANSPVPRTPTHVQLRHVAQDPIEAALIGRSGILRRRTLRERTEQRLVGVEQLDVVPLVVQEDVVWRLEMTLGEEYPHRLRGAVVNKRIQGFPLRCEPGHWLSPDGLRPTCCESLRAPRRLWLAPALSVKGSGWKSRNEPKHVSKA